MNLFKKIESPEAPKALGPYSQAIALDIARPLIFVSGQLPLDPKSGKLITGDITVLTRQIIANIEAILHEAGSRLELVVRTEIFLKDLKDFSAMNEEYAKHFKGQATPARQTVQVAGLPLDSPIEMSCIAVRS